MSEWNWFSSVPFKQLGSASDLPSGRSDVLLWQSAHVARNNLLNTCCWLVETAQQAAEIQCAVFHGTCGNFVSHCQSHQWHHHQHRNLCYSISILEGK